MRRRVMPLVALAVLLLGFVGALGCLGAGAAAADDLPPPVFPSGLPGPDVVPGDTEPTSGPTYVVTPGSAGTALPAPDKAGSGTAVDDARKALNRLRSKQVPATQVAAPVAARTEVDQGGANWWLIGSGGLLLLLLTEFGRLSSGARHRRRDA